MTYFYLQVFKHSLNIIETLYYCSVLHWAYRASIYSLYNQNSNLLTTCIDKTLHSYGFSVFWKFTARIKLLTATIQIIDLKGIDSKKQSSLH